MCGIQSTYLYRYCLPTSPGLASCASVITTATTEPAWHRRLRAKRSQARTLVRLATARQLLQDHHSAQQPPMSKNGAGASDKDDGWVVASHRRKPKQQMVQCCRDGCKGTCPLNVVYRASQADGVPGIFSSAVKSTGFHLALTSKSSNQATIRFSRRSSASRPNSRRSTWTALCFAHKDFRFRIDSENRLKLNPLAYDIPPAILKFEISSAI